MSMLNLGKFTECLWKYKRFCDKTLWTKKELPKFYFANILSRRIHLSVQPPKMIFEICRRVQEKDYYYKANDTKICGIQYLPATGGSKFSEPITETDAELLKDLVYLNWSEPDFAKKNISYDALSGWLGTLIPYKFMPVTSNHFRHTISYLFDLNQRIFELSDYEFFVHSQKFFFLTKKRLKEFNLDSLYLKELAEYVKFSYPKSVLKRDYEEHDWNWLTHDFHLFVFREVLELDSNVETNKSRKIAPKVITDCYEKPEVLNIYVP
jgi:hypothetical protein